MSDRTVRSWAAYLPCLRCAAVRRGIVRLRADGSEDWTCDRCYANAPVKGADR